MTTTLRLLILVISAFAFAWHLLKRDKREHPALKESQQSIYFPNSAPPMNTTTAVPRCHASGTEIFAGEIRIRGRIQSSRRD